MAAGQVASGLWPGPRSGSRCEGGRGAGRLALVAKASVEMRPQMTAGQGGVVMGQWVNGLMGCLGGEVVRW
jgi:hypothetical protein